MAAGLRAPQHDAADGTSVVVLLYRVEGGGHTWPGGLQYLGDLDAIWEFFRRHPRPAAPAR